MPIIRSATPFGPASAAALASSATLGKGGKGPEAAALMAPLAEIDLHGVKYYSGYRCTVAGQPVLLARTGYTGEDGFELFTAAAGVEAQWQALATAGAGDGLVPAGLAAGSSPVRVGWAALARSGLSHGASRIPPPVVLAPTLRNRCGGPHGFRNTSVVVVPHLIGPQRGWQLATASRALRHADRPIEPC